MLTDAGELLFMERAWAIYARELLDELRTHCPDEIHQQQYDAIDTFIKTGKWDENRRDITLSEGHDSSG